MGTGLEEVRRRNRRFSPKTFWSVMVFTLGYTMIVLCTTWWMAEVHYEGKLGKEIVQVETELRNSEDLRGTLRDQRDEARDYGDLCSQALNAANLWYELGAPDQGREAVSRQVDACLTESGRDVNSDNR